MLNDIGGRKFIFAVVAITIAGVFVVTGKLTAEAWTGFATVIGGIYVAGNLGADYIAKKNAGSSDQTQ